MSKLILSTGDVEKDAQLLAPSKDETLVNKESFEEARDKERKANEATAEGAGRNALTEIPHIEGQVIAVVADEPKEKKVVPATPVAASAPVVVNESVVPDSRPSGLKS